MEVLLKHARVIYDANCAVYNQFEFSERDGDGKDTTVLGPNTAKMKDITQRLLNAKKSVVTLRKAWDEGRKVIVDRALSSLIAEGHIQQILNLKGEITPALKFKWSQALRRQFDQLKAQAWFIIDSTFSPSPARVTEVKEFYASLCANPDYHRVIPPGKGDPSDTDIHLILFSGVAILPLLTNDGEIYKVGKELTEKKFAAAVRGLPEVRL